MKRVRAGSVYVYNPAGADLWDARTDLKEGDHVRVVNLPGCPRANTMGHAHVQRLDGSFAGLVLTASLDSVQEYRAYLQRKIAAMESAQVQK